MYGDRPVEFAQTHMVGAGGITQRYQRPKEVRAIADRVRKWGGTPESCQSCQCRPAVRVVANLALCGLCREQRFLRGPIPFDPQGLKPREQRADEDVDGLQLRGLSVVFNSPSVDMGFVEYIRPSAADRTFAESLDTRYLWNHNSDMTLGRTSAGTLRAQKTTRGISVEVDPPRWAAGQVESVKRRDISGQSFGFITLTDEWHMQDGEPTRDILDMVVIEYSGVSFPAYPATTLRVAKSDERSAWLREQDTAERLRLVR